MVDASTKLHTTRHPQAVGAAQVVGIFFSQPVIVAIDLVTIDHNSPCVSFFFLHIQT